MSFITSGMAVFSRTYVPPSGGVSATGGTVTTYSSGGTTYNLHTFTSGGTFEVTSGGSIDFLIVGGGGGSNPNGAGGFYDACGGGGGRVVYQTNVVISTGSFPVVVGTGGSITSTISYPNTITEVQATSSSFNSIVASKGNNATYNIYHIPLIGGSSGSGNAGGNSDGGGLYSGGGGGGDSTPGNSAIDNYIGGSGGNGTACSITGSSLYYGGGGSGASQSETLPGGLGGGGSGGNYYGNRGTGGTNGTGGGAGGGWNIITSTLTGNVGGSGIVIIRYVV
jgi:hypothetical protein